MKNVTKQELIIMIAKNSNYFIKEIKEVVDNAFNELEINGVKKIVINGRVVIGSMITQISIGNNNKRVDLNFIVR